MRKYFDLLELFCSKDFSPQTQRVLHGCTLRVNLQDGFPLSTTRKVSQKDMIDAALRFLQQQSPTTQRQLDGVLTYMQQWLKEPPISPLCPARCVWNIPIQQTPEIAFLHPIALQWSIHQHRLSCMVQEYTANVYRDVPQALAVYALLTHMMVQQLDVEVGELIWTANHATLDSEQLEHARKQLMQAPRPLCTVAIYRHPHRIWDYEPQDFECIGYTCCDQDI